MIAICVFALHTRRKQFILDVYDTFCSIVKVLVPSESIMAIGGPIFHTLLRLPSTVMPMLLAH